MQLTGERLVPGLSSPRTEQDHLARYEFAIPYVQGKDVLDIACGTGYGASLLKEKGARSVCGADIDPETVAHAKDQYRNVRFIVSDIQTLKSKHQYDVITCFETIEHVREYKTGLKNIFHALRPGGLLLLSTPNRRITSPEAKTLSDKPQNPFHEREFTETEMMRLLIDTGFVSIKRFGQRQQYYVKVRTFRRLYNYLFKPSIKTSPDVTPVTNLHPRYMVFVAHKSHSSDSQ